jgi:hypothetical protein
MRLPALPSVKNCYQGSVGYCQQTTSALDALLNRRHSHASARCFDKPSRMLHMKIRPLIKVFVGTQSRSIIISWENHYTPLNYLFFRKVHYRRKFSLSFLANCIK